MCLYLHAVKLVIVTEPAKMIHHNGRESMNRDCVAGTVLAYDADGNLYIHNRDPDMMYGDKDMWPTVRNGTIQLFRDYWRVIQSGPDTPYGSSFRNAEVMVLREVK